MRLRPWEFRRLRFPSELMMALQPDLYDASKPPANAEATGHMAVTAWWIERRQRYGNAPPPVAELLARERARG